MAIELNIHTPSEFINPLLAKRAVIDNDFDKFISSLADLKKVNQGEYEEHQKNAVRDFLKSSFDYDINTKGNIDWAIYANGSVEVIIEAKKLDNKAEMITKSDANKKALQEAIKYFFDERNDGNVNIKHIIVLTAFEWFVFDAKDFERLFWNDRDFKKIYENYTNPTSLLSKTGDVYSEIGKLLESKKANLIDRLEIDCAYFDLKNNHNQKELIYIYKLLSQEVLLKKFNPNDANSLNKEFYNELLYILGLEEVKNRGKKLIQSAKVSHGDSFYENISNKLSQYGKSNDFENIVGLIIVWINRILFLKLLEGQIVKWNKPGAKKFLTIDAIPDFDMLESFFFDILGTPVGKRRHKDLDYIPYLNSSLFEFHELERDLISIANLSDDAMMRYYSKTIIKDKYSKRKTGEVKTLQYLFEFLDAYNFGDEGGEEIATQDKSLISASVLGLIFEKINGYKDGSFYTPSFITMYMTRESLRRSILDKFNATFHSLDAKSFEELKRYSCKHNHKDDFLEKANEIINSITVCDPAVGSGHFLVSMLGEIVYTKAELGLFSLSSETKIRLENDELIPMLDGELFEYKKPKDFDSNNHRLQKLLFEEKKRIIENQLFGVDINPNSAQITKLRLWIELLKNAYYHKNGTLETLPNIDINIKIGNSLISRFGLQDELKINNIKEEIKHYKQVVNEYKENLGSKKEVMTSIQNLKDKFRLTLKAEHKAIQKLNEKLKEYMSEYGYDKLSPDLAVIAATNRYGQTPNLFGDEQDIKIQTKLLAELDKLQTEIEEIENGKIYEDAFEWRFEFPEVLDENGDFVGFDIVIGNPPYIMEYDNKSAFDGLRDKPCYQGKTDIWHLFSCQALDVLNQNGLVSYIAKNQWLESQSASNMRKSIYENGDILSIIDFGINMVFEEASQQTMVFFIKKDTTNLTHQIAYKKVINNISNEKIAKLLYEAEDENLKITIKKIPKTYDEKANLTFSSSENEEILTKVEQKKNFEFDEKKEMAQGIIGAPDKAFIISKNELDNFSGDEKTYLKMLHTNTSRYYTPNTEQYIFYIFAKNFKDKDINNFPNIKKHFEPSKDDLIQRKISYKTPDKPYFYLHRERDESFFKEADKLVFAARTDGSNFTFTSESFYGSRNLFFIKSDRVNLRYITALLNSKLMYFYMHERLKHTGDLLQIDKNQFMRIPLYVADEKATNKIADIVDQILDAKKDGKDTTELEDQIDAMAYKLYGLTDEEIKVVEGRE